jgi:hypothetical protein
MLAIDFEQNSDIILLSVVEEALAVSDAGTEYLSLALLAAKLNIHYIIGLLNVRYDLVWWAYLDLLFLVSVQRRRWKQVGSIISILGIASSYQWQAFYH